MKRLLESMTTQYTEEEMEIIQECNVRNYIEFNYGWLRRIKRAYHKPGDFKPRNVTNNVFHSALNRGMDWGILIMRGIKPMGKYRLSTKGEELVVEYERERKDNGSSDEEES